MTEAKNIISGFREVVQDLLVPELKSIKTEIQYMQKAIDTNTVEIKELRKETQEEFRAVRSELKDIGSEIKELRTEIRELLFKLIIPLSERVTRIEQKLNM